VRNRCQWPNVVVGHAFGARIFAEGMETMRECRLDGEGDERYANMDSTKVRTANLCFLTKSFSACTDSQAGTFTF
jgi:hypothetical protein